MTIAALTTFAGPGIGLPCALWPDSGGCRSAARFGRSGFAGDVRDNPDDMAPIDPEQLRELIDLARKRAGDSRRILFENISDLFISTDAQLTDRERVLMRDILTKLIGEIEMEVRTRLAERLAGTEDAPHDLIALLANDEIAVARPILLTSRLLTDPDLIEVIKHRTMEHRLAIASRRGLTAGVTDALVEEGEEDVIAELVENHDAQISRLAMEYLVEESRRVDRFQEPLLRRPDLRPELAHRMFWWVSAALRRHVLANYNLDTGSLDHHLEQATDDAVGALPGAVPGKADDLTAELQRNGMLTERFLVQALREGQVPVFIAGLARLLKLGIRTANFIVYDPGGEGLALACKAAEFGRANFASIFLLTRGAQEGRVVDAVTSPARLNEILTFFDGVTPESAAVALRYWRQDSAYLDAIEELAAAEQRSGQRPPPAD